MTQPELFPSAAELASLADTHFMRNRRVVREVASSADLYSAAALLSAVDWSGYAQSMSVARLRGRLCRLADALEATEGAA